MAHSQQELQQLLEGLMGGQIIGEDIFPDEDLFPGVGSFRVYFQPPTFMKEPYIKYERDNSWVSRADNVMYLFMKRYQVTVVDRDPDSPIPDLVEALPYTRFDRFFITRGLNHWVYNTYY